MSSDLKSSAEGVGAGFLATRFAWSHVRARNRWMLLGMPRVLPSLSWRRASEMRFWLDAFTEKEYGSQKDWKKVMGVGVFGKHVFPFFTGGALG